MILFVIGVVYQLWELVQGRGILVDTWTVLSVLPLGIIISPVLFYLGWYFQARAKNQQFDLNRAMGGHFLGFCRALYGILAAITILLAIIGALGSFYIDSRLLLVCWIGIAFVGEPLPYAYSWLSVGVWLGVSIVLAGAASFLPARAAGRISVREAISYE